MKKLFFLMMTLLLTTTALAIETCFDPSQAGPGEACGIYTFEECPNRFVGDNPYYQCQWNGEFCEEGRMCVPEGFEEIPELSTGGIVAIVLALVLGGLFVAHKR